MISFRALLLGLSVLLAAVPSHAQSLWGLIAPHQERYERPHSTSGLSQGEAWDLYSPHQRDLSFAGCLDQFPKRRAFELGRLSPGMKPLALCSDSFAVLYSQASKTPVVVVERLSAAQIRNAKGEERTNQFFADPRIPAAGRAELSDYHLQNPPVDRGHQAPAGDAPSPRAMAQSFALSNMIPQDPTNNRKIWSKIESDVRKFVLRTPGSVYVFTGPLFDAGHGTIGENHVWKPTRLFKLVYDEGSGRAWAYVQPNAPAPIEKPLSYEAFLGATGMHLLGGLPITGTIASY